ncbi:hypothetical protein A3D62_00430 [Candidatus Kaiserbacteria bacterium RIFCSPHIGHO2_02_FULL_49_11]|uniref:CvpA family protein n=1 Tax=Candidatus Kaiserbacteria bacterium RIFCSPHIGHO2_02_FULL_49_11 TaxID=1798489 RepID=A0A1F6CZB2_9BACT|nr:MAG: hypothetical protein A3D62_00430 [Candidatus Kaiserbacteria bacterium RIFCSPHIGHO2_02_FULL_49_11]
MNIDIINTLSGALSTDILIIGALFILFVVYGLRYGKSGSVSLMLSLYVGILAFISFPYREKIALYGSSEFQVALLYILAFCVGVFVAHYIVRRFVFAEYPMSRVVRIAQAALLAAGSTGLLFAFAYHALPVSTLYDFDAVIDSLFSSQYFFWWLVAPLAVLALVSRRRT